MPIGKRGENLIFLISQPRAGSTLLQRILGSHSDIHTISEPWIMLHPFYAIRPDGIETQYEHSMAQMGVSSFLAALPAGEDDYVEAMRRMYSHLYARALEGSGKPRFLDKTPRYYLIIPDLQKLFPSARFVILLRNPLAVLASVLMTWAGDDSTVLHKVRHDLQRAPAMLIDGSRLLGEACTVVHYEKLVSDPASVLEPLCADLGLAFQPSMIDYCGQTDKEKKWVMGDQAAVYAHTKPEPARADRWKSNLLGNAMWRNWARGYLSELGPDVVRAMGYDYDELWTVLRGRCRKRGIIWLDWKTAMKQPSQRNLGQVARVRVATIVCRGKALWRATINSLRTQGPIATLRRAIQARRRQSPME